MISLEGAEGSTNRASHSDVPRAASRGAIEQAYRLAESDLVPALVAQARLEPAMAAQVSALAGKLVHTLRSERRHGFGVEALMKEFSLSTREGVALMCLAESLLRIPDAKTRDLLIRDKLAKGDWHAHLGASPSWLVNASAWGLLITGKLVATSSEQGMAASLMRAAARGGEPIIRRAMDLAMRLLGRQFVTGQTIEEALHHARPFEARGFLYSFDMLGEAAVDEKDAMRYVAAYAHAIEAIGAANRGRGVYNGAGISVKLSALHPRYGYTQMGRVRSELYPRLYELALLASRHDIGFNIDAEEADRLEPSLDLLEMLCSEGAFGDWQGLGFVVQAYQKRAPFVVDHLLGLAERSKRRLMVRLVKGAYWDSEIKRAQVDGQVDYPVFTRKAYTDICYLVCAKRLLARRDLVFPQFATHNAHTFSAIYRLAGEQFRRGDYEFQCLHGMGETLYKHVVGRDNLNRPCRIYAPVGTHETLLPYLVRRLLENGANSSFVHQLVDEAIATDELIADPVEVAVRFGGAPHPQIILPVDMFGGTRKNSKGLDLSNRMEREALEQAIDQSRQCQFAAAPMLASPTRSQSRPKPILNPANHADVLGHVAEATAEDIEAAMTAAEAAVAAWGCTSSAERADILDRAADLIERGRDHLCAVIIREAGRTMPNTVSEVREAVDFCRYYASQIRQWPEGAYEPLGPAVCISPWNFPLAIFTGQIAAALAAGNPVLAKPAEQTPLIAAEVVRLLYRAGLPREVLQLLPGAGEVGAALVADRRTKAVLFTGSTDVARHIQRALAERGNIPLVAETGGQNAMIVDSSALAEQVVGDVLSSAFDSAGQRCSALRVLCLQEDIADRVLGLLKGAMAELAVGDPARLETDVGPVIDAEAKAALVSYLGRRRDRVLFETRLPALPDAATFVAPTLLEIGSIGELTHEVFGPILHVMRFPRNGLSRLIDDINATGFGLTFGIHSRIDETIENAVGQAKAGNIYVNRNMIGAVVGVQPFGGEGLSGTGPKAGGPLYLQRLVRRGPFPKLDGLRDESRMQDLATLMSWVKDGTADLLGAADRQQLLGIFEEYRVTSPLAAELALPGPVGEENRLRFLPRGSVLGVARSLVDAMHQFGAALATGNRLILDSGDQSAPPVSKLLDRLPGQLRGSIAAPFAPQEAEFGAVLVANETDAARMAQTVAAKCGPIISVQCGNPAYSLALLVKEKTVSINSAAAGGNASLMAIGK